MKRLEEHLFWIETNSQPSLSIWKQNCVINYDLEAHLLKLIKYAHELWPILTRGKTPDQAQEQVIGTFSFCPH